MALNSPGHHQFHDFEDYFLDTKTEDGVAEMSTAYRRTNPPPPDEATIKNLLVGEAVHRLIQELLVTDEFEHEREITWHIEVKAYPDIIHNWSNNRTEIDELDRSDIIPLPITLKTTTNVYGYNQCTVW